MSTFTKRSVIVWTKASYASMIGTPEDPASHSAFFEFDEKTQEFVNNDKMDDNGGTINFTEDTVISIKHFVDEAAAQEWIDFNKDLASKHNLVMVSSRISPIIS